MIWFITPNRKRKRALMSDDESGDEAKKRKSDDDEDCKEAVTFILQTFGIGSGWPRKNY